VSVTENSNPTMKSLRELSIRKEIEDVNRMLAWMTPEAAMHVLSKCHETQRGRQRKKLLEKYG
jgi:hypothetical protein